MLGSYLRVQDLGLWHYYPTTLRVDAVVRHGGIIVCSENGIMWWVEMMEGHWLMSEAEAGGKY